MFYGGPSAAFLLQKMNIKVDAWSYYRYFKDAYDKEATAWLCKQETVLNVKKLLLIYVQTESPLATMASFYGVYHGPED